MTASVYHEGLVTCPQCGDIRQGNNRQECSKCRNEGHLYRMMSVADLAASIEQNECDGFHFVAIKRALIRDALLLVEIKIGTAVMT